MTHEAVYCPKCGFQSPPEARFCKRCGTNLEAVSRALTGELAPPDNAALTSEMEIAYAKEFSRAIYHLLSSVGVFLVMLFIFRGAFWVWFMLFWVANSVRDVVQAYLLKQQIKNPVAFQAALEAFRDEKHKKKRRRKGDREELPPPPPQTSFPPRVPSGEYVPPARTTGELEKPRELTFDHDNPPPSVTEGTTRLLDEEQAQQVAPEDARYVPPSAARHRE
jgi:hypothetical protein